MAVPRPQADVICEEVPETGECVLLRPGAGRVLALNALGAAVWEILDGARGSRELAALLAEAAEVTLERAQADVEALLARLEEEGFLAPQSET